MKPLVPDRENTAAVVLAGGRGTRMRDADKGLLELGAAPLAAWALEALRSQVAEVFISANRNAGAYARLGAEVLADAWPDFRGPLAGLHAALRRSERPWLLAVPCDTPGLPGDLRAQLGAAAQAAGARAAYAVVDGDPLYPLCLLARGLYANLHAALLRGHHAVGRWLQAQGAVAVTVERWAALPLNLNTPERLAAARASLETWTPKPRT